jgi:hypothetical protein
MYGPSNSPGADDANRERPHSVACYRALDRLTCAMAHVSPSHGISHSKSCRSSPCRTDTTVPPGDGRRFCVMRAKIDRQGSCFLIARLSLSANEHHPRSARLARTMIYCKCSIISYMPFLRYVLLARRPWRFNGLHTRATSKVLAVRHTRSGHRQDARAPHIALHFAAATLLFALVVTTE